VAPYFAASMIRPTVRATNSAHSSADPFCGGGSRGGGGGGGAGAARPPPIERSNAPPASNTSGFTAYRPTARTV
jgi:hypothetical protein